MKNESLSPRIYRQTARAQAASATAARIVDAFIARLRTGWFDEIRLDDVAADAGVTVQTVIRRFGGKDGLLDACGKQLSAEIIESRQLSPGDVPGAIEIIIDEYERHGDFVMRLLGQEDRYPAIRALTDQGRAHHRHWVGEVFAPWLSRLDEAARSEVHDRLVIALDVYIWKLVRIDMRRSTAALRETIRGLCAAALRTAFDALQSTPIPENTDA